MLVMSKTWVHLYTNSQDRLHSYGGNHLGTCQEGQERIRERKTPARRTKQATFRMGKHCLTQHEALEFHLPPLISPSTPPRQEGTKGRNGKEACEAAGKKWVNFHPAGEKGASKGGISRGHCINLLPATKLRSAEHLHFGLKILFANGRRIRATYNIQHNKAPQKSWPCSPSRVLYCCILLFPN